MEFERRYTVTWHPLPEESPRISAYRIPYIFLETTIIGLHFAADNIGLFSLKFFWWAHKFCLFLQEWRFSRSRSSKVIDVGTNQKRVCDFLLVRNSNLGPILHRFGAFARFLCSWLHSYSTLILGCSRFNYQIAHVGVSPRISLKLFGREIIFEVFQPTVCDHGTYVNVTDRRTDRQTIVPVIRKLHDSLTVREHCKLLPQNTRRPTRYAISDS